MNRLAALLFVILLLNYECIQGQDVLKVLDPTGNCELSTTISYSSKNGFCGNTILLNSDSSFLKEGGCEGGSHITIGYWKKIGNQIELSPLPQSQIKLVCEIEFSGRTTNNTKTTFVIVDKTGKAVRNFTITPFKEAKELAFDSAFDSKMLRDKYEEVYKTDDKGCVTIDIGKYQMVEFSQLRVISGNKCSVLTKGLPETIKIMLNVNAYGFVYPELEYRYMEKTFSYKLCRNKLKRGDFVLKRDK